MALPLGWPPRPASSHRSIRFFADGTTTDDFEDNAFLFGSTAATSMVDPVPNVVGGDRADAAAVGTSARPGSPMGRGNTTPEGSPPQTLPVGYRHAHTIMIVNDGSNGLHFTFDETTDVGAGAGIHGRVKAGETLVMEFRYEAGIAVKSALSGDATEFRIFAW